MDISITIKYHSGQMAKEKRYVTGGVYFLQPIMYTIHRYEHSNKRRSTSKSRIASNEKKIPLAEWHYIVPALERSKYLIYTE